MAADTRTAPRPATRAEARAATRPSAASRGSRPRPPEPVGRIRLARWIGLCAAAEAIGMTAASSAAVVGDALFPASRSNAQTLAVLALVVAGGLVEGAALGILQAAGLRRWLPGFRAPWWIVATVIVAGLGWAAASAPAQFGSGSGAAGGELFPWLVVGGGLALGAVMGAVLGTAQAGALLGAVRHPWRWIGLSALAWTPTMAVIFVGATLPDVTWTSAAIVVTGAVTGAVAGGLLGAISGSLWGVLDAPSWSNVLARGLVRSPLGRPLDRTLVLLRLTGRVTGRTIELPVQYAPAPDAIVVFPGHPERKKWWRNLRSPAPVQVFVRGRWSLGRGIALNPGDPGFREAEAAYHARFPRARDLPGGFPVLVRIALSDAPSWARTPQ